ncbi:E3 ubiquitin-protein ligase PPP1R11-like isoform X2 [Liolophura sinensis]|uniref:E3 ubiquitin-protein ligase PPP1R11-like isoform X2 n=1 Tax=Liolophura sinensis TaxID=3198878 RepID=UPI003158E385
MAEANHPQTDEITVTETVQESASTSPRLVLKLKKPKNDKKVQWSNDTVDNEHMNKKKSKCCCIYEKPKLFGESSSEDEDGDDHDCTSHCRGHRKKCFRADIPEESSDSVGPSHSADP